MNRTKFFIALIALSMIAITLAGCATPTSVTPTVAPSSAAFPFTLADDAGRPVTMKVAPKRIVSLAPSNTETIYALGRGDQLVGDTEYCDYPPEAKTKPHIGGFSKIDLEKVVGLDPDLVLATNIHAKSVVPELEKRGLTVFVIDPKNMGEVISKLTTFGRLLGANDEASKLAAQLQSRVDAVAARVAAAKTKPRVFYEIDQTLYTPGPGSFIDDMLIKAGGANIAANAKGNFTQLSVETIIAQDPEVIFLGDMNFGETPDKLRARAGWSNISAVKSGRIIPLTNEDVISRPGPRIVEGFEILARGLHPDLFK